MSTRRRGPAVAKRQLRLKLRRARYDADKTQNEVAEALDWSPSKVLRIENGQVTVATSDLMALLTQYPSLASEQVEDLIELARESRRPTVASRYRDVLPAPLLEWLEHEAYASVIRQYETQFVPGVLQTDDYATGIVQGILGAGTDEERAKRIVAARLERAEPLVGLDGPRMDFIIDEAALRRSVGNEDGSRGHLPMIEQLEYLKRANLHRDAWAVRAPRVRRPGRRSDDVLRKP
jgi:transcriptional regulator with XRE-family HTH domain